MAGVTGHARRLELTVLHVDSSQRVVDDGRVFLLDKVVLSEAFDVKDQERREFCDLVAADDALGLLGRHAVVLGENLSDGHLRDDVLLDHTLKYGAGRKVDGEEEEGRLCRLDLYSHWCKGSVNCTR